MKRKFGTLARAAVLAGAMLSVGAHPGVAASHLEQVATAPEPAATVARFAVEALPGMTDAELKAHTLWTMRSALNVAALQCQFSPYLRATSTYNALLRQHAAELTGAFNAITRYFLRTSGARTGHRAFDTYATRTNQNWTTFDAQLAFCRAAADVGKRALALPRGAFTDFSVREVPPLREVAASRPRLVALEPHLDWPAIPDVAKVRTRR